MQDVMKDKKKKNAQKPVKTPLLALSTNKYESRRRVFPSNSESRAESANSYSGTLLSISSGSPYQSSQNYHPLLRHV